MAKRKLNTGAKKQAKAVPKKKATAKKKPAAKKKSAARKKSSGKKPGTKAVKKAVKKTRGKQRKSNSGKIVSNGTVDLECFLSTACAQHMKLGDQCAELQQLRSFRDGFMLSHAEGRDLVRDYRHIAPGIVNAIEADRNKHQVYAYIYGEIQNAIQHIQSGQLLQTMQVYKAMVLRLLQHYRLNSKSETAAV